MAISSSRLKISFGKLIPAILLLIVFVQTAYSQTNGDKARPNILLIIADDMNWTDSEPYGNPDIQTPNIERLSEQGMRFTNMFATTAMCSPFRMELYTGLRPVRNGAYPNHSEIYIGGKSMVHYFRDLGYRVALAGKSHVGPKQSFPFEYYENYETDSSIPGELQEIIVDGSEEPFFLVIAHNSPHLPWTEGDRSQYNEEELQIPEFLIDTPATREQLVKYYAEVSHFDQTLGKYLDYLDEAGVKDDTIILYTSEQGSAFPFAKWTTYDMGLKTQFIVRWPSMVQPASRNDALVQTVDVLPTLLEAVGVDPDTVDTGISATSMDADFDGQSFLDVLTGVKADHRQYTFGVQTTRGINNGAEAYPVRSVRNKKYKYILNLNYETPFSNNQTAIDGRGFVYRDWVKYSEDNPDISTRVRLYRYRPEEELYDIETDPFELNNLANKPESIVIKNQMNKILLDWMKSQGDSGMGTEMRALYRIGFN